MTTIVTLDYTGNYQDPVSAGYPLGHGYRWFLPWLVRFSAPDDWSPFGQGGANPYVYCRGDPINHSDPSGHMWFPEDDLALLEDVRTAPAALGAPAVLETDDRPISVEQAQRRPAASTSAAGQPPVHTTQPPIHLEAPPPGHVRPTPKHLEAPIPEDWGVQAGDKLDVLRRQRDNLRWQTEALEEVVERAPNEMLNESISNLGDDLKNFETNLNSFMEDFRVKLNDRNIDVIGMRNIRNNLYGIINENVGLTDRINNLVRRAPFAPIVVDPNGIPAPIP
jgi:RHS repeat-associated protein